MYRLFITIISIFLIYSCSKDKNPVEQKDEKEITFNQYLNITTEKNEYIYGVDFTDWLMIKGILFNNAQDTFYSKLGDGFNSSINQEKLYIAEGSDAYFEKFDSLNNNWVNIQRGILYEGTKVISLVSDCTYTFSSFSRFDSTSTGKYRFLFKYYRKIDTLFSTDTLKDTSNVFFIK